MICFVSKAHAKGESKAASKADGTFYPDSKCWETIQIGKYRLIMKNQLPPFVTETEIDIYNWPSYNSPHPIGTVFTLTQE